MKDAIGQEITVGCTIAHAHMGHAGFSKYTVLKVTAKQVTVDSGCTWRKRRMISLDPDTFIVIDANLEALKAS